MAASTTIPGNWQEFLRVDENKVELFSFLATSTASIYSNKQVISTLHTDVLCNQPRDLSRLSPCTHGVKKPTPGLFYIWKML